MVVDMVHIDRQIAIWAGWIAGPAFGVAMMAAPEYLKLDPPYSGLLFWGGLIVFFVTIVVVVALSLHDDKVKKKVVGPILTMALGTLILGVGIAWYFWPTNKIEVAVEDEHPEKQLSIPISIAKLSKPGYSRFSGLHPDLDKPDNNASENDPPWVGIADVFISNISKDRAVTLKIFLVAIDEKGQMNRLEADGRGPYGNFMGRSDFATKIYQRNGIEPGYSFILSPLVLKAQETAHGTLPFIINPFGFTKEINNQILVYWASHFIPTAGTPPFKFHLEIQDVISGTKIEIPVPGNGYSGKY